MTVSLAEATAAARRIQAGYRPPQNRDAAIEQDARLLAGFVLAGQDCDGSSDCAAAAHVHGCFADDGKCDEPNEHGLAGDTERLRTALQRVAETTALPYAAEPMLLVDLARDIARAALVGGDSP